MDPSDHIIWTAESRRTSVSSLLCFDFQRWNPGHLDRHCYLFGSSNSVLLKSSRVLVASCDLIIQNILISAQILRSLIVQKCAASFNICWCLSELELSKDVIGLWDCEISEHDLRKNDVISATLLPASRSTWSYMQTLTTGRRKIRSSLYLQRYWVLSKRYFEVIKPKIVLPCGATLSPSHHWSSEICCQWALFALWVSSL